MGITDESRVDIEVSWVEVINGRQSNGSLHDLALCDAREFHGALLHGPVQRRRMRMYEKYKYLVIISIISCSGTFIDYGKSAAPFCPFLM